MLRKRALAEPASENQEEEKARIAPALAAWRFGAEWRRFVCIRRRFIEKPPPTLLARSPDALLTRAYNVVALMRKMRNRLVQAGGVHSGAGAGAEIAGDT